MGVSSRVELGPKRAAERRLRPTLPPDAEPAVDAQAQPVDEELDLLSAVQTLPVKHRAVVVARFYLDWPVEQIADALQVPAGTVKSRLHRALSTLEARREVRT